MKHRRYGVNQTDRVNSNKGTILNPGCFCAQKINSSCFRDFLIVAGAFAFPIFFFTFLFSTYATSASDITRSAIIELTNNDRSAQGISQLEENSKLTQAAEEKAENMIEKNYFAHTSPEGLTPWHWIDKENYDYNYAGENLAMDFTTVEKMNEAWMDSPTHRANVMSDKYFDVGVGIAQGIIDGHETTAVVQMFGSGDKNSSAHMPKDEIKKANEKMREMPNTLPKLPVHEEGKILFHSFTPIITYPVSGATLQDESTEVIGRAMPETKVFVFDFNTMLGSATADKDGWFRIMFNNLSSGNHQLSVKNEEMRLAKTVEDMKEQRVAFNLNLEKLNFEYQMVQDSSDAVGNYILKAVLNKSGCLVRFAGKVVALGDSKEITISVPKRMLSTVIKIEDSAGNRIYKFMDFANYSQGMEDETAFQKFAQTLAGDSDIASSGRETLTKNLGLKLADADY